MASNSARTHSTTSWIRIRNAASRLYSVRGDIRKCFNMLKETAVDLEKERQFDMVKELENLAVVLLDAFDAIESVENAAVIIDHYMNLPSAIESVGNNYEPPQEPSQLTDFEKLLETEVARLDAKSSSSTVSQSMIRQFREAVWNVHHAGQPMPGDDQDDIVMTSTDSNIRNTMCPISGKHVTELENPVRSVDCKHIYQQKEIMHYLRLKGGRGSCPIAGCPRMLQAHKLVPDPLLIIEIQELRDTMKNQATDTNAIEDFILVDED